MLNNKVECTHVHTRFCVFEKLRNDFPGTSAHTDLCTMLHMNNGHLRCHRGWNGWLTKWASRRASIDIYPLKMNERSPATSYSLLFTFFLLSRHKLPPHNRPSSPEPLISKHIQWYLPPLNFPDVNTRIGTCDHVCCVHAHVTQ
jgi:hypothetical protein